MTMRAEAQLFDVLPPRTESMMTSDGVRLDADVYRPVSADRFPVLLMRQPYGRRIASTVCYAHPAWYAARGYIVVIQDCRGRGTSAGRFAPLIDDAADGADAIKWAAHLAGSDGAVGTYGFSYQGTNQLLAAARRPGPLKAMAPAMIGWDLRNDWAFENDAFSLNAGLGWAIQMAAENARLAGDSTAFHELFLASRSLPLNEAVVARPAIMEKHRRYSHYFDWLDHSEDDEFWRLISPSASAEILASAGPPMLFVGGWYDSHLPGTISAFRRIATAGNVPARLIVGPWAHFPWGRKLGQVDFGARAVGRIDELQIRWFDHWLKGHSNGVEVESKIRLFDMGSLAWLDLDRWPNEPLHFYLTGTGRSAIDPEDGKLLTEAHCGGAERIVHDPWRAVPAIGGAFGTPPGPVDRSLVDSRPDVLTFTTAAFETPLRIAGEVTARLFIDSDAASFDVACTLSRVSSGGAAFPIAEGYRHVRTASATGEVVVGMRATCMTLNPGDALRLSIAGAAFPSYPVNPGTGDDPTRARQSDCRTITLTILHGTEHASRVSIGM